MFRCILSLAIPFALASLGHAQGFKMEPGPKSPADSLKCIKVRPGFMVELMVAEPLVMDPIAFAWGPDGKFWVVEMGDYPLGAGGKNKPGGRIKYLEKTKADGPYDKMTVFMDNLGYPTGVFPYDKGVLVTCAPDIFYAAVGKDGKADKKKILFTGFKEGNQQHRVNGLTWGIDNWIYGANGDSGGVVKSIKTGKEVDIRGRDFRFKVETGEFEAVSGQSQFGRCRDDWGNWFGCNNSNPMFLFVLEDRYLKRNPHVLYPDPKVQVSVNPGASQVFPISKPLLRFNTPAALNHFTSACSTIIYRDNLFGKEFAGNMFVSEPVHNLIHREIMKPKGVTFTSQRADDEQTSEFLASSDNWFRPTMIQVGPDGALWIADMYRYVIEHPEWIPKDWQKKLDLRAGHDMGRIYRVVPVGKKPREIPNFDKMIVNQWIEALKSPNGWTRDTAHQLLVTRKHNQAAMAVIARDLDTFAKKGANHQARLHAYFAYDSLKGWDRQALMAFVTDTHPAIRKHSLVRAEDFDLNLDPETRNKFLAVLEKDTDERVRQQVAYSLSEISNSPALARVLRSNADNPYILAAGLSSLSGRNWDLVLREILKDKVPNPLFGPLMRMAKAVGEPEDANRLVVLQLRFQGDLPAGQQIALVADLIDVMKKNDLSLQQVLKNAGDSGAQSLARLTTIHADAVKTLANPKSALSEKKVAIRLLARSLGNDRDDHTLLLTFLTPRTPDDVQAAVIQQIGGTFDPRVPGLLLGPWKSYSPALRGQVLDTLFARPFWTRMTLDAIKQKQIPAQEIDAIRRQRLLQHKDSGIREAAETIFAAASDRDRGKVVDLYWLQLPAKTDAARGAKLFAKACATCHKLGEIGQNVGPDFASIGDKSVQGLLTAILDPNRAVETRYINYVATTKKGLTFNGIIVSETSTTITLAGNDGKQHQLLRNELDDLSSTGKSLMPEGLEKDLTPQDMADVIAHVRANLPAAKRKEFPGNTPRTLRPGKDGRLHLLPASAAIYGPSIVIEKVYGNLGYWSKPEDRAIWTVELAKETTFSVWLDYACANDSAGNVIAIQCGSEKIAHKIRGTGSWDNYQLQSIGALKLPAGTHEIVVRGEGPIRNALLDLKEVELRPR